MNSLWLSAQLHFLLLILLSQRVAGVLLQSWISEHDSGIGGALVPALQWHRTRAILRPYRTRS